MSGPRAALRRIETREALLLAFFAVFIVLARAALRWHLHVPGHAMFGTVLFLLLARACVARPLAASATGLLAGLATAALGMGQGGPILVVRMLLPGLVVDAGAQLASRGDAARAASFGALHGAVVGALAGAVGFFPTAAVEALAGTPGGLVVRHALVSAGAKAAFGALGGIAAAAIARRLDDHGLLAREIASPPPAVDWRKAE